MSGLREKVTAVAPTRLDFGGGWTDVPPYPERRGGFVCNIAINRYATATITHSAPGETPVKTPGGNPDYQAGHPQRGKPVPMSLPPLAAAALRRYNSLDLEPLRDCHLRDRHRTHRHRTHRHLADLRPTDLHLTSLHVTLDSDFPTGAGLGGSSAAGVAVIAALRASRGLPVHTTDARNEIAEESRTLEVNDMGIAGGRQDHYAAAHGGALGITFTDTTHAVPIQLNTRTEKELESRCILAYTGEARISANTITAVIDAFATGESNVTAALDSMKTLAINMRDALNAGDIDSLSTLVEEQWQYQRSLHPLITTPLIDTLHKAARTAGATGFKALGASGGGCVIAIADKGRENDVRNAMLQHATILNWQIAHHGVTVHTT